MTSVAAFVGVTQFGYVSWAVFEFFGEGGSACCRCRGLEGAGRRQRRRAGHRHLGGVGADRQRPGCAQSRRINAIRSLKGYGNVLWGARTLALGTEWTYISVRRLFIHVGQSLRQSLQWVVFETNDQRLQSCVSRDIHAFLTMLWQQGALFGSTPAEAFFVTCDASNNPPQARMLGQLCIDIGLAPVYPAEFLVMRITEKTAVPEAHA